MGHWLCGSATPKQKTKQTKKHNEKRVLAQHKKTTNWLRRYKQKTKIPLEGSPQPWDTGCTPKTAKKNENLCVHIGNNNCNLYVGRAAPTNLTRSDTISARR
jgi:hypothetical protein